MNPIQPRLYSPKEKEHLLREAQRLFPKGTKFISAANPWMDWDIKTANGGPYTEWIHDAWKGGFAIYAQGARGLLYAYGAWAEIKEKPKTVEEHCIPLTFN